MESCHKCGCEFSYIEKLKALSSVNYKGEIKCKKCGCLHKVERHNLLMPTLFALPMLILIFLIQYKQSNKVFYYFILGYLVYDACIKLLEPLFTKVVVVKKKK